MLSNASLSFLSRFVDSWVRDVVVVVVVGVVVVVVVAVVVEIGRAHV